MAPNLEQKVTADLTMESPSETSHPKPELSEPEEDSVTGFNAGAASEEEPKAECVPDADNAASNITVADSSKTAGDVEQKIDIPLVVELAPESKELVPQDLIDITEDTDDIIRLIVIVSMISPFAESANTLIHVGEFVLEVTPTITIREIKYEITNTFGICYEDMALVYIGQFLSDARSVEYYFIDNGQTLHLLVESQNQLFKKVFEAFTRLGEETAWFATRSFIHTMHTKYHVGGLGDTPTITQEELIHELEQLHIPDSDDSDISSADCSCDCEDEDEVSDIDEDEMSDIDDDLSDIVDDDVSDIDEDEISDIDDEEESDLDDDDESDIDD